MTPRSELIPHVSGCRLETLDTSAAPHNWLFRFARGVTLNVESIWRLISDGRIVVTSLDHGEMFGRSTPVDSAATCLSTIGESAARTASYDTATGDLTIEFTDALRLEVIVNSSGYESWTFSDGRGNTFAALGGGEIAMWHS